MSDKMRSRVWWGGALIALLTLLAYLPAMRGGFIWDDNDYVTENPTLRDLAGLKRIWFEPGATPQYYPLVHTTFWLEYHCWGLNPAGYHVVNVLLHLLAALLLWRCLHRLELPGAWLAAGIFALHPVQVESVAWITERKNVLSGVFYFAAALAWFKCMDNQTADHRPRDRKPEPRPMVAGPAVRSPVVHGRYYWYFLALLLFTCALLSKTVACSLPAALLLVRWWRQGRLRVRDVLPTLPFFLLGLALGLNTAHMEKHTVGAVGADWSLSLLERGLIAGRALWFYAGKLAWPADLTFIYPRWVINPAVWWQWLFPLAALAVVGTLWSGRRRFGRGPLVAVLFFAGTLFPALGFFDVYPMRFSFVADHFQYLASAGLMALAAAGLARLPARAVWALPVALGVLTWQQAHSYRDLKTLWTDTLARNPGCWLAHNNLGLVLGAQGQDEAAADHYRAALRLKPGYADALNNLGKLAFERGRVEEADQLYEAALKSEPRHKSVLINLGAVRLIQGRLEEAVALFWTVLNAEPGDADALNNLGVALTEKQDYDEAVGCFVKALQIKPEMVSGRVNLGKALGRMGRPDEAIAQIELALRLDPGNTAALAELAKILAARGQTAPAIARYRELVRLAPQDAIAHYNLGLLLGMAGNTDDAIEQYRLALQWQADYAEAHNNLGVALVIKQQLAEAVGHFSEALRLNPDYAEAHNNFAFALVRLGRRDEAVQHLKEALRLKPDYENARQQLRELGVEPNPPVESKNVPATPPQ